MVALGGLADFFRTPLQPCRKRPGARRLDASTPRLGIIPDIRTDPNFFHHTQPVTALTDFHPDQRENVT